DVWLAHLGPYRLTNSVESSSGFLPGRRPQRENGRSPVARCSMRKNLVSANSERPNHRTPLRTKQMSALHSWRGQLAGGQSARPLGAANSACEDRELAAEPLSGPAPSRDRMECGALSATRAALPPADVAWRKRARGLPHQPSAVPCGLLQNWARSN